MSITIANGTLLMVQGCTQIQLNRMDKRVRLPKCRADGVVVDNWTQVNAHIVLGVDTILGGVNLKYEEGRLTAVQVGMASAAVSNKHPLPSVSVSSQGDLVLAIDNATMQWKSTEGYYAGGLRWLGPSAHAS